MTQAQGSSSRPPKKNNAQAEDYRRRTIEVSSSQFARLAPSGVLGLLVAILGGGIGRWLRPTLGGVGRWL